MKNTTIGSVLLAATFASGCTFLFGTDDFLGEDAGQQQTDSGSQRDAGTPDSGLADSGPSDAGCTMTTCGETCTDTGRDPLHCGGCDNACPEAPENATATCTEGECGFVCNAGHDLVVGSCAPRPAPRPIAPMSTSTATSKRPTFRWELAPRNDGARVEICADRACSSVITTFNAPGSSGRPGTDLPTGVVFWRLYGLRGGDAGIVPSPTWQAYIRARSAPVDTSWGTVPDVNGDGFADLLRRGEPGELHVHHGSPSGIDTTPTTVVPAPADAGSSFGVSVASAGDINGDGFADVVVGAPNSTATTGRVYLFLGSPTGLDLIPANTLEVSSTDSSFGERVRSAADSNGDGYADVLITWANLPHLYFGSASGLQPDRMGVVSTHASQLPNWALCDINGDGYEDLILTHSGVPADVGSASIHMGNPSGFSSAATLTVEGPDGPGSFFGSGLACGDIDGDGYAEVIVGNSSETGHERVYVFRGSATGLTPEEPTILVPESDHQAYYFGSALASNDFDGDGFDDIAVGAYYEHDSPIRLYRGGADGVETAVRLRIPAPTGIAFFGRSMLNVGDLNADGFSDLFVSTDLNEPARSYILLGSASGLSELPAVTLLP